VHSSPHTRRLAALAAAGLVAVFAVVLHLRPGGSFVVRAIDDLGEAAAAGIAAVPCFRRAAGGYGRWRWSWALLGAALASWSIGELIWSYYELISSKETPFPSLADAGFLLFPLLALPGLLVRPSSAFAGRGRFRAVLDGTMVAASLFILSWSSSLGAVYRAGAQTDFGMIVGLGYPAGDLIMLMVAVLVGSRSRVHAGLLLLVGGLGSMAIADSAFAYMTAAGTYQTGAFSDVAWVAAFLMIGLSALYPNPEDRDAAPQVESALLLALPYVLVLGGAAAVCAGIVEHKAGPVSLAVAAVALLALLTRQLLTVLDNRRLAMDVLAQQAELRFRAFHDALTGLANRALFYDRLAHALELHKRDMRPVSVVFADLDDFKAVNDSYGHDVGDALLVAVADRLGAVVRTGDTIARLGGDEFAVLVEDGGDTAGLAARLQEALLEPIMVGERTVPIRASIGTTTLDPAKGDTSIQELLKQADLAMYAAKQDGKGITVTYTPALRSDADDDLDLRLTLTDDIRAGLVRTVFQPIVRADGAAYALEALARWRYRGVPVPPEQFIPVADRCGMLGELDLLMLNNALSRFAAAADTHERVLVSVNIGLRNADQTALPEALSAALSRYGLSSSDLVVEVSESEAFADLRALEALRELGVSLAVDDFGVGYSNLSRLSALRPDIVKLDRSFVEPLKDPFASTRLLAGVIGLAHELGALVIGEGVETAGQRDILCRLGCDALQGFFIGSPTPEPWDAEPVLDPA
jgi:diguanylate cyclase (GGDEF)-like protein